MPGQRIAVHLRHHLRFYGAALIGLGCYLFAPLLPQMIRLIAAGDVFFASYLLAMVAMAIRLGAADLEARAAQEDEGIALVVLIVLTTIGFCCAAVITVLHQRQTPAAFPLALAIAAAPLGWLTLHTIAAFHYANLFYAPPARAGATGPPGGLVFPGTERPGTWDFIYFAFVVGMTAQVSDVQVLSTKVRRATLGHSVVSFFFNTAIIAMAVNAAMTVAA